MGLLKTLFILLFVYYALKFLARLFAPYLIKKAADTIKKKAEQQFGGQQPKDTVKEGETIIDKAPRKHRQGNETVGEYIDFEEIE